MTFEQAQEFVNRAEKYGFISGGNLIVAPEGGYFMRVAREDERPGVLTGETQSLGGAIEKISLARKAAEVGKPATNNWIVTLTGVRRDRDAQQLRDFVLNEVSTADYEARGAEYIFNQLDFRDE